MSELKVPVENVLKAVPDNLREVVIVGVDGDGRAYIAASCGAMRTLRLLDNASRKIVTGDVAGVMDSKLRLK